MVKKLTHEEVAAEIKAKRPDVAQLSRYTKNTVKLQMKCLKCGFDQWFITKGNLLVKNSQCPNCRVNTSHGTRGKGTRVRWTKQKVQTVLNEEYKGFKVYDDFKKGCEKATFCCDKGHEFKMEWNRFYRNTKRCPVCVPHSNAKTQEKFEEEVYGLVGDSYKLVSAYTNNLTKVNLYHEGCDEIYSVRPGDFIRKGHRCSCERESSSYGEGYMAALLKENRVEFEEQKTYEDLRDKGLLRFDFFLPQLNLCVEIQGKQHYEAVKMWGGEEGLEERKRRDQLKRDYCKANGIKLIELKYIRKRDAESFRSVLEKEGIL